MKKVFALLWFIALAGNSIAAPTYDATNSATTTSANSLSYSLTVGGACTNPILFVDVAIYHGSVGSVSSMTIGGGAATQLAISTSSTERQLETWYRKGVSGGSNAIVINLAGTYLYIGSAARSYCGIDQVTSFGTVQTSTSGETVTVSSAVGELVYDAGFISGTQAFMTADAGQTERYDFPVVSTDQPMVGSDEAGAASVVMSWTAADNTQYWMQIAVPLKPAAAGGSTRRPIGAFVYHQ